VPAHPPLPEGRRSATSCRVLGLQLAKRCLRFMQLGRVDVAQERDVDRRKNVVVLLPFLLDLASRARSVAARSSKTRAFCFCAIARASHRTLPLRLSYLPGRAATGTRRECGAFPPRARSLQWRFRSSRTRRRLRRRMPPLSRAQSSRPGDTSHSPARDMQRSHCAFRRDRHFFRSIASVHSATAKQWLYLSETQTAECRARPN